MNFKDMHKILDYVFTHMDDYSYLGYEGEYLVDWDKLRDATEAHFKKEGEK